MIYFNRLEDLNFHLLLLVDFYYSVLSLHSFKLLLNMINIKYI